MKLDNPQGEFEHISKDVSGQPEYGFRTTFGQEEIVNLKTGKSNMNFYKPSQVLNPTGCAHDFNVEDMAKREFTCSKCNWGVSVHINQIEETPEGMFITIKQGKFKVT